MRIVYSEGEWGSETEFTELPGICVSEWCLISEVNTFIPRRLPKLGRDSIGQERDVISAGGGHPQLLK